MYIHVGHRKTLANESNVILKVLTEQRKTLVTQIQMKKIVYEKRLQNFVRVFDPVYIKVKSMQRSGTGAIRTQIKPSKPKREVTNIQKYKENIL